MTWDVTYRLPTATFEPGQIDVACRAVIARWPFLALTTGPDRCVFEVPAARAVAWELESELGTETRDRWARIGYQRDAPIFIDICFFVDDGIPEDGIAPSARFSFDTGWSGNGVCPSVATKLCDELALHLGATEIEKPVATVRTPSGPYMMESRSISAFLDRDLEWTVDRTLGLLWKLLGEDAIDETTADPIDDEQDIVCFELEAGWSIVMWPDGFHVNTIPITRMLAEDMDCVAVVATVVDDLLWTMTVIERDRIVDRHVSPVDFDRLSERYAAAWTGTRGNAVTMARLVGTPAAVIDKYYAKAPGAPDARAFADDEHPLSDPRVWLDLWRRIGIRVPGLDHKHVVLRLADVAPWRSLPVDLGV